MTNFPFLFAAYTAIWVLLFLYIASIGRRNHSLQREIDELHKLIKRHGDSGRAQETNR
ncbi:MAG: CcmD family protein [Deltaproteobacteria bacterium]|nr:CcmD family protein [Deltaproteobacteria bacterium]MBI3388063.1 CcmD family protein [Deltaproteobacteria bacterium]